MLTIQPMTIRRARAFVGAHHRHHKAPAGGLFAVGVADADNCVRGVAIVGRPVARLLDDECTAEVTRVCTDGAPNACSMLLGACARAARALGYHRLITYTLVAESGASLRGAGWRPTRTVPAQTWSRPSRERADDHPTGQKIRWEATLARRL